MRKIYLSICLLAIAFLFLYNPFVVKSATFCESFNANDCPTPECKVETRTIGGGCSSQAAQSLVCVANSDAASYCYPENTFGIIKSNEEGNKNVVFNYEGLPTTNWKFKTGSSGPQVFVPVSFDGAVSSLPQIIFENSASNQHCKYYEFPFQRQAQVFSFNLPLINSRMENGRPYCTYSVAPINEKFREISSLGGRAIPQKIYDLKNSGVSSTELGGLCDYFSAPASGNVCSLQAQCDINIAQGERSTFGITFEVDSCGNKIVNADNSGSPLQVFPSNQNPQPPTIYVRAASFVESCSGKYIGQENKCGNGVIDEGEECDDGNTKDGDGCSSLCRKETSTTDFGEIEVKGGVYNYLTLVVNDIRLIAYGKLSSNMIQDSPDDIIIMENVETRVWMHKDLYSQEYEIFVKFVPAKDLVNLRNHFPSKEWGSVNSFFFVTEARIEKSPDGKKELIFSSKYKKAEDTFSKPYDGSSITILNPDGEKTERIELKDLDTNIRAVQNSIDIALKFYITFHDKNLKASLYGVGISGNKGGGTIKNSLVDDWISIDYLNGYDQDELSKGGRFETELYQKIRQSLEGKTNEAKKKFPCKK